MVFQNVTSRPVFAKRIARLCDKQILRDINLEEKADTAIQLDHQHRGLISLPILPSFGNWRSTGSNDRN
jgi:hypothetical protein